MNLLERSSSRALVASSAVLLAIGCGNTDEPATNGGTGGVAAGGTTGGSGASTTGGNAPGGGSGGSDAMGGTGGMDVGGAGGMDVGGTGGMDVGGAGGMDVGGAGASNAGAGAGGMPMWGVETRPTGQTCVAPMTQKTQPAKLTETGCVDPMAPTKPAATMIPYSVITPLWSDAAVKTRFFALPDDTQIHVKDCSDPAAPECQDPLSGGGTYEDEGDWTFPDGTVLMKTFAFEGKLIETRLLVRKTEFDWWGYSYHWNDEQTEADLWDDNTDGYDVEVPGPDGMVNWHYPSRAQCLQCHTTAAGVALGPESSQLDFDFTYPNGVTGNQLETLERLDIFDSPLPDLPAYPAPSDTTASLEQRARAYLHTNCGICHRAGGNFTDFDARYSVDLADMTVCGVPVDKSVPDEYMLDNPLRLDPGHPENSVISLRMHSLESEFRMPQIGSGVVDEMGTQLIDDWISSLTTCP